MMTTDNLVPYSLLNGELHQQQIGLTAAELHGLVSGILCGGNQDSSWLTLVHSLTNEGMAFSSPLSQQVQQVRDQTLAALAGDDFAFRLLLPLDDTDIFACADALAGWVNHFLLGLGVVQTKLDKIKGDVGEVIDDLRAIGQLGYDPEDDQEQLAHDLEDVSEYVRMAAMLCYNEFSQQRMAGMQSEPPTPTLH